MSSVTQGVIKHKVGLLNLAAELGNVSRACKVMGFSRDTFYRYKSAVEAGGVEALLEANRKKPNPKNVEFINDLGIPFGCQYWPLVVRRPRQASNLTGACDR